MVMPVGRATENAVVLVMDRGNEDLKLITCLLEKTGFQVLQSANRAEILNLCSVINNSVQLVIIDTGTSGIHIAELLDQVQAANPRIRILLISGQSESEAARNLSVTGNVRGHLSRPFRRAQFLGSVLEVAKGPLVKTA